MNRLQEQFETCETFEECKILLTTSQLEDDAFQVLRNFQLDSVVRIRIFLSVFLIYFFPSETLGHDTTTTSLVDLASKIVNSTDYLERKNLILEFTIQFEIWRNQDLEQFKTDLLNHYHGLTVEMLNVEDESVKQKFQQTKSIIRECAKKIGFDDELTNYIPIIFESNAFLRQSQKAFYDVLHQDIENISFVHLKESLLFFRDFFLMFLKSDRREEICSSLDIPFIEQQFMNQVYEESDYRKLLQYMFFLLKEIQSHARDAFVHEKLEELQSSPIDVPKMILSLYEGVEYFIEDILEFEKTITEKK